MNTNGVCNLWLSNASFGDLLRDNKGDWIAGFSCNLQTYSSELAELHAVIKGLELAWDKGFWRILLECDSFEVVNLITSFLDGVGIANSLLGSCRTWLARN